MSYVELDHVSVERSGTLVLDDVSLDIAAGELIGVVGSSGAGKTTLLRAIAGLDPIASGTLVIDGIEVTRAGPASRGVSMVFQSTTLFPHRDVRGNIAFPLEVRHVARDEIAERVGAEARAMHIVELLGRSERELSAGEAQLVQIARAMVRKPNLLLLDEPLAHLDPPLSHQLQLELRVLQQGYGVTTVAATNDPHEAMSLPDRLVVLDAGRTVQIGPPVEVYSRPASLAAASCTGEMATLAARVDRDSTGFWLVHPAFRRRAWPPSLAGYVGATVIVGLRPAWVALAPDGPIAGVVARTVPGTGRIAVALGDQPVDPHLAELVELPADPTRHARGEQVRFRIDELALFDPHTGNRLP
jgi:ABC-type sugar transport system ATPase subunit